MPETEHRDARRRLCVLIRQSESREREAARPVKVIADQVLFGLTLVSPCVTHISGAIGKRCRR